MTKREEIINLAKEYYWVCGWLNVETREPVAPTYEKAIELMADFAELYSKRQKEC